eukprot:Seg831.11 transcript_id=Seg831.11/GoldUCD/mRNA.D3Y31 product="E3 ISG15-protein ligase HERC5" protein_id=Seg831.11/GoldUCD/D3Y31
MQSKGSLVKQASGPFHSDVVLLRSPDDTTVPKQQPKIELMERGHIFYGVTFYKEWSAGQVQNKIKDLFANILGDMGGFQIATSVHTRVVKPSLDRDQQFDGAFLYRMFRNKSLYIKPDHELFQETSTFQREEEDGSDNDTATTHSSKRIKFDIQEIIESDSEDFPPFCSDTASAGTSISTAVYEPKSSSQDTPFTHEHLSFDSLSSHLAHITPNLLERALLPVTRLVVRRRRLWEDTIEKIPSFFDKPDCVTNIEVEFVGEEGVDGGGVRREFFCKLFEKSAGKIMSGAENSLTFIRDSQRLERNEYEYFGQAIALAFLNGCEGPHNWCTNLIEYILDPEDRSIQYKAEGIPDGMVRTAVMQLKAVADQENMDKLLDQDVLADA